MPGLLTWAQPAPQLTTPTRRGCPLGAADGANSGPPLSPWHESRPPDSGPAPSIVRGLKLLPYTAADAMVASETTGTETSRSVALPEPPWLVAPQPATVRSSPAFQRSRSWDVVNWIGAIVDALDRRISATADSCVALLYEGLTRISAASRAWPPVPVSVVRPISRSMSVGSAVPVRRLSTTQCAAVRTHVELIRDPPQKCLANGVPDDAAACSETVNV